MDETGLTECVKSRSIQETIWDLESEEDDEDKAARVPDIAKDEVRVLFGC